MAKSPLAGRVKRRLAASVGVVSAARFYRTCLTHTLMRLGRDPRWRTVLAVSPDSDVSAPYWPRGIERLPQGNGDLGVRMQRLFRRLPPGPAIIVGSDIPAIKASDIARAFRLLGNADAVLGRAPDGGYWLVGLRRAPACLRLLPTCAGQARMRLPTRCAISKGGASPSRQRSATSIPKRITAASRGSWERLIAPR